MSLKNETKHNKAKIWQIGLFALNNAATNFYMLFTSFITYYCVGIAGLLTVAVGFILTGMRIFDGITDPMIGYIIDKTDGKFGKFRPFMILGNVIMILSTIIMIKTTHLVPIDFRYLYFIAIYAIYIIGYTFQTACTKAGQACLTNDPKQRPIFSMFDGVYVVIMFTVMQLVISKNFVPMAGGFTPMFFDLLWITVVIISAVFTILAVIGIWEKDCTKNFGVGVAQKLEFKEYWDVIKNNRAIQMLIVSASTDKLAATIMQNSILTIILFGILAQDYGLSGTIQMVAIIPTLIVGLLGMNFARKAGMKKAIVFASWGGLIVLTIFAFVVFTTDLTQLSLSNLNLTTILFILLWVLRGAFQNVSGNIVIPMIADCADYETYRTGRYVPGMMGTLFSFVDKLISSFSTSIVAVGLGLIGYTTILPQVGDPITETIKVFYIALAFGAPIVGLICNIIAMKFYPLTKEKMEEIQETISKIKEENNVA